MVDVPDRMGDKPRKIMKSVYFGGDKIGNYPVVNVDGGPKLIWKDMQYELIPNDGALKGSYSIASEQEFNRFIGKR